MSGEKQITELPARPVVCAPRCTCAQQTPLERSIIRRGHILPNEVLTTSSYRNDLLTQASLAMLDDGLPCEMGCLPPPGAHTRKNYLAGGV